MDECGTWAGNDPLLISYHDTRWCHEVHDDDEIFALLVLESMSVGLSWRLILHREERYREVCDGLRPSLCALYDDEKVDKLMRTDGIVHMRGKVESIGRNARAFEEVRKEYGTFDSWIWSFTEGKAIDHRLEDVASTPSRNELSDLVSKELKKKGLCYMGPVITYSWLQAIGMINDHLVSCPKRP